jgi:hypothetical protein
MIASAFHGFADSMSESYPSRVVVTMEKGFSAVFDGMRSGAN